MRLASGYAGRRIGLTLFVESPRVIVKRISVGVSDVDSSGSTSNPWLRL